MNLASFLLQFVAGYSLGMAINLLRACARHNPSDRDQLGSWKAELSPTRVDAFLGEYPHLTERK